MLNNLRKVLSSFIAPKAQPTQQAPRMVEVTTIPEGVSGRSFRTRVSKPSEREFKPMNGKFTISHLELLSSQYLRDAIAGLGAWSSLAKAFAAFEKQQTSRRTEKDWSAYELAKDEFHQWNSVTDNDKQMTDESVIVALDKISEVPVQKGSDQTDAIIARVLNKDIQTVRDDRIKKAATKTAARKEMLSHIASDIWNFSAEGDEAQLSGAKVAAKAVQTLEWIASTWQGEPAMIAGECLLIEHDLQIIEAIAQSEENHESESQL